MLNPLSSYEKLFQPLLLASRPPLLTSPNQIFLQVLPPGMSDSGCPTINHEHEVYANGNVGRILGSENVNSMLVALLQRYQFEL